ncbi:Polygalacturonase qrt3 [Turnera subulata]|uniref:Polygalacturonase qrt3 n=1 Tax=Turnera subulata TaxID=218843 RepID=A0A9Q0G382_9ROSI|nr:Polygalacturonase qrt3 [Turnera subulata]
MYDLKRKSMGLVPAAMREEATKPLLLSMFFVGFSCMMITTHVNGETSTQFGKFWGAGNYQDQIRKLQANFKPSLTRRELDSSISPSTPTSPALAPSPEGQGIQQPNVNGPRVYQVTLYGADPTGKTDSTEAIEKAIQEAASDGGGGGGDLMQGIANLGGSQIHLQGGNYLISKPLQLPAGIGNLMITGGTLRASDDFPTDGYLIQLSAPSSSSSSSYNFEYITIKDVMLDCNYRGGGISVIKSLRTNIDNTYIAHFNSDGILVQGGHETYIRNSFLGQHITAGGDPGERNFSGTGINLMGNDNAVTDVVIFSAAVGIMVSGAANILTGVHCYNKATGFGGTGIYLKLPGLTQTRIVNCYLDYSGIVAEDPVQLTISNTFFLGDAYIVLKSINGVVRGVTIVDNMFSGYDKGIDIVQLDQTNGPFKQIDQVVVERNNVKGMNIRSTVARGSAQGNGTSWTVDFGPVLLFPNLINHVYYSLSSSDASFPNHNLRNVSQNQVVIQSDAAIPATVFVTVDQGVTI